MVNLSRKTSDKNVSGPALGKAGSQRTLSIPVLVGTVVALCVLLPGLYFWRARQAEKGADALIERADALAAEGAWAQSAEYVFLYLSLRPNDAEMRIRLAETYDRLSAQTPYLDRAIELYYQALATAPSDRQSSLRQRLAELLIQAQRFASAEVEAKKLLEGDPSDARAHKSLALSLYRQAESRGLRTSDGRGLSAVGEALEHAFRLNSADAQLALTLADVYRREPHLLSSKARALSDDQRLELADQCLDQLVRADPKQATAYLARYQYRTSNRLPASEDDLEQAKTLAPTNPTVLLAAGDDCRRKALARPAKSQQRSELLEQAAQFYRRAIDEAPTWEQAYFSLGDVYVLTDEIDRAVQAWEQGLEKCGRTSISLNVRLAEALISQGNLIRAQTCIDTLESAAANRRQRGFAESQLGFARKTEVLKGQLLLANRETDKAIDMLQRVAGGPKGGSADSVFTYQALMVLGNAYAFQGQQERAANTFDDAAAALPDAAEPHVAAAAAWMAIDRPESAALHLERAIALEDSAATRLLLAAARLRHQLKLPWTERDWSVADKLVAEARDLQKESIENNDAWKFRVLEAEYLREKAEHEGNRAAGIEAALIVLRSAEKDSSTTGLGALATAYERLGATADADRALEKLRATSSDRAGAYLGSARILSRRKQFEAAHGVIQQGLALVPPDQRLPLQLGIVDLFEQQDRQSEAWKTLINLHNEAPANQGLIERVIDYAIDHGKFDDAEKFENTLRALPGVAASTWQVYRVRRLLSQTTDSADAKLNEAERILTDVVRQRPTWPVALVLTGDLLEHRGDSAKAAAKYQEAIELGDQRLPVYQRLIQLLYELRQFDEASTYLAKLRNRPEDFADISRLEISLAVRSGEMDRALETARLGVASRPDDPLPQIWLGQLLLTADKLEEAERTLRRAIEIDPTDPRPYGALINYFVRTKQLDQARAAVRELGQRVSVPPAQRAIAVAIGYDVIGDKDQALAHFREAVRLDPQSSEAHERMAASILGSDKASAEAELRRALELNPNSRIARRMLAGLLADRGGEQRWHEALQILSGAADGDMVKPQAADQRLQALLRARRGGADNLASARHILQELIADPQSAAANDRLLLAQILEAEGNSEAANKEYLSLASAKGAPQEHLEAYIDCQLRHDQLTDVGQWLDKLDRLAPNSTRALALRVRWLYARSQASEVDAVLEQAGERLVKGGNAKQQPAAEQRLQAALIIGDLYLSVRNFAAAERWYRLACKLDPSQFSRLAQSLVEQQRVAEAVQLCVDAADRDSSSRPARSLIDVLLRAAPGTADSATAEALLKRALKIHTNDPQLLGPLATWRLVQQDIDEASRLFRRLLELQPDNVNAMNDLAAVLAEQPSQTTEALKYIDRAIELAGSQPNLLDTKGSILLSLGKAQEAVAILNIAASAPNPDPRYHFHLAVGHFRTGNLGRARESLTIARAHELKRQILTKTDSKWLAELDAHLR